MNTKLFVLCTIFVVGCPQQGYSDCGHFFVKKHHAVAVVQQVAVVQPYYVPVPAAYYSAGADITAEALAVKVTALVEQRITQALSQRLTQQQTAPPRVAHGVFAKCTNCHSGPNAAAGLVLDGQTGVSCLTLYKFGRIVGQGRDVPPKMAAVVAGLTKEERGAMFDAMLDLVQPTPAKVPPPDPLPNGDLE